MKKTKLFPGVAMACLATIFSCAKTDVQPIGETEELQINQTNYTSEEPIVFELSIGQEEFNALVEPILEDLTIETIMTITPQMAHNIATILTVPNEPSDPVGVIFTRFCSEQNLSDCNSWAMGMLLTAGCALSASYDGDTGVYQFDADCY